MTSDEILADMHGNAPYFAPTIAGTSTMIGPSKQRSGFFTRLCSRLFEGMAALHDRRAKVIVDYYGQDRWSDSIEREIFIDRRM